VSIAPRSPPREGHARRVHERSAPALGPWCAQPERVGPAAGGEGAWRRAGLRIEPGSRCA